MKILITGAKGFIGRNLCLRLKEEGFNDIIEISRESSDAELVAGLKEADFVYHIAGVNRPDNINDFSVGNSALTKRIIEVLKSKDTVTPVMLSSSIQVENNDPYGVSKGMAEEYLKEYAEKTGAKYFIYRLPNVFGKWCKPNYNSFIATFCHNIANDIDIKVNDSSSPINLIYIDDLCNELIELLHGEINEGYQHVLPIYSTTVGDVARLLYKFKVSRQTLITEEVGIGFERALYSTWLSYLRPEQFSYPVISHSDPRGVFCEMLKTKSSGQFSFFTAHPGVTRGGHYHHSKNEKFLVIKGEATFRFQNVTTHEKYALDVSSGSFRIVETVPGWAHDITNVGQDELIVMLWANEIFDRDAPDTIARPLR